VEKLSSGLLRCGLYALISAQLLCFLLATSNVQNAVSLMKFLTICSNIRPRSRIHWDALPASYAAARLRKPCSQFMAVGGSRRGSKYSKHFKQVLCPGQLQPAIIESRITVLQAQFFSKTRWIFWPSSWAREGRLRT
jgi:hypothetical protein